MNSTDRARAKELMLEAMPYYFILPCLSLACNQFDMFAKECTWLDVFIYFVLVEGFVFLDHYYLLHKFRFHKHNVHHSFHKEIDPWTSFAFYWQDGLSQGMPVLYSAFIVPVTSRVVFSFIAIVGLWTIFIHTNTGIRLPLMLDYEYHRIHHLKNWYNFGLFTQLFDRVFGTIKHPFRGKLHTIAADLATESAI